MKDFHPLHTVSGQMVIPMGTHHVCGECGNSYVCDCARCLVWFAASCPACRPDMAKHSEHTDNTSSGYRFDPEPEEPQQGSLF